MSSAHKHADPANACNIPGLRRSLIGSDHMTIEAPTLANYKRPRIVARAGMNGLCGVVDCRRPPHRKVLPVCEEHAWDIAMDLWRDETAQMAIEAARQRSEEWQESREDLVRAKWEEGMEKTRNAVTAPGLIYYIQVEDQIKIGYSASFEERLKAYPPMAKVLATHPGTRGTESDMHKKFSQHLASRREWFSCCDEITEHIAQVRQSFKQEYPVSA